jgi:hypothetical protein
MWMGFLSLQPIRGRCNYMANTSTIPACAIWKPTNTCKGAMKRSPTMLFPYLALLFRKEKPTILGEVKKSSALHRETYPHAMSSRHPSSCHGLHESRETKTPEETCLKRATLNSLLLQLRKWTARTRKFEFPQDHQKCPSKTLTLKLGGLFFLFV